MKRLHKLTRNFTEVDIDEEIVIMRLDNGELLSLADSAAMIWRLIDGQRDQPALVEVLKAEFAADEQEIAQDVGNLLRQLREAGLIAEG